MIPCGKSIFVFLTTLALFGGGLFSEPSKTNKPNIIIIFSDDHGYTDLGIHGIDPNVQTPVLDQLAAGGALMQNGYSTAPQCVPSRAGLMSGRVQNTFGTKGNGTAAPIPFNVPTIAERLKVLGGYRTGMVGKWHLAPPRPLAEGEKQFSGETPDWAPNHRESEYAPNFRGFDDYRNGASTTSFTNFDLQGNAIHPQTVKDPRNRVLVQGEAAAAFVEKNKDETFFLYFAPYGPHLPRIEKTDPYYTNFPELDYPHFSDEMDDIRRQGLGLIKAVDDAVGAIIAKLREHGLEENTLILFAGDNGAQPKYWNYFGGNGTISRWDGSENVPLRGEKGSLWEGGIKVPMLAYWKGTIPPNQVIPESITALDFTATTLALAGGQIPPEFSGNNIIPRLTGQEGSVNRTEPMFWHWGKEVAMRDGDWKIHRIGNRFSLLNLAEDPNELYDQKLRYPERLKDMQKKMITWFNALPEEGRSGLQPTKDNLYITGAEKEITPDPRYQTPYENPKPAVYPSPLQTLEAK